MRLRADERLIGWSCLACKVDLSAIDYPVLPLPCPRCGERKWVVPYIAKGRDWVMADKCRQPLDRGGSGVVSLRAEGRVVENRVTENAGAGPSLGDAIGLIGGPTPEGIHKWRDLLRCPKRYYLRYGERLVNENSTSGALAFGALMHEVLARHYRRENPYEMLDEIARKGYDAAVIEDVSRVYAAYLKKYPRKDDPYYIGVKAKSWVERYVDVIPNKLTTRMDLVYERKGGLVVVDHKTTSAMTSDVTEGFMMDPQVLTLMAGAMADKNLLRDRRLTGVEINVVVRTKIPQFTRVRHAFDVETVDKFVHTVEAWDALRIGLERLGWPRSYECINKYRMPCAYREYCLYGTTTGLMRAPDGVTL